ncbi:MAG: hypothetical protein APF81_06380 [Desulfosporosinus sp. BRH_c37]|nr:MAG: hypothetical protein APF81_06380 [Desulfosporosinus sp. BRH_c37]
MNKILVPITLCLSLLFTYSLPVFASTTTSPTTTRLAGQTRYETASAIAKQGSQSDYAILAYGENYPDALASTPLAKKYNAPILLTTSNSLPACTKQALIDLQTKNVIVVGGTGVISSSIDIELQSMGINVTRIFGNDKYETAIKIAQQITTSSELFVCSSEDYPDALSVAPIAALKQIPIILVPRDYLPDSVKSYLSSVNISKTYVIGYSDVIDDSVINQFSNSERILGSDKYNRNIAVNQKFNTEFSPDRICLATGEGFADALTGSAYAAKISSPIILINNATPENTKSYYQQRLANASNVSIFGGTAAVSDSQIESLNSILNVDKGATVLPMGVRLNKSSTTITIGGSDTITATLDMPNATGNPVYGNSNNVTWTSNNPAVATVSLGNIVGVSSGTAVITVATTDGSKTANCVVTVSNPETIGTKITLNISNLTKIGATTATFKYQMLDNNKDITQTIPISRISAVASINAPVSLNALEGKGTITYNSTSDIDKPLIITLIDTVTGICVSLNSTSGPSSASGSGSPIPSGISSGYADLKVSKITITTTKIAFRNMNTDEYSNLGYATYSVFDQNGNDISNSGLENRLTFNSAVGTITGRNGLLRIELNTNVDPTTLTEVIINGRDSISGVSTSATLIVIPYAMEIISQ